MCWALCRVLTVNKVLSEGYTLCSVVAGLKLRGYLLHKQDILKQRTISCGPIIPPRNIGTFMSTAVVTFDTMLKLKKVVCKRFRIVVLSLF